MNKLLKLLPNLVIFWYPQSVKFFIRTFEHTVLYLEEDLAVGLMFKLLFTPLFHDASWVGRILSFFFRSFRIMVGIFAFILVTVLVLGLALFWFILPIIAFLNLFDLTYLDWVLKGLLFSGVGLFLIDSFSHPLKKVSQVKSVNEVWQTTGVKKNKTNLSDLLKTHQVEHLLKYLEQTPDTFMNFPQPTVEESLYLNKVLELGRKYHAKYLGPEYFFVARLFFTPDVDNLLLKLNLSLADFTDSLDLLVKFEKMWRVVWVWEEEFHVKHLKGVNRGWLGAPTPNLDSVSYDLTKKASRERIEDFIGRGSVVSEVVNILSLEQGRNVVLVGEAGSGRTTLVEYLAKLIVSGDAPEALSTKRVMQLDLTKLLSGVMSQGDLATKVQMVFDEVQASGEIIVYVDEIQNMGIGEAGSQLNLFSLLLPFIESDTVQFLASTENSSYVKILEKDPSFARLFAKVELPPANEAETLDILKNRSIEAEQLKRVSFSLLALKRIATLSKQYITSKVLPDSALSVFAECFLYVQNGWVNDEVVSRVIQTKVNIPVVESSNEDKAKLLNLEVEIHQQLIDQEQAVKVVSDALRRASANLKDKNRPIGSFLFVGPTGTGKTELSKVLARVFFHPHVTASGSAAVSASEIASSSANWQTSRNDTFGNFIRFDMSEYQTQESIARLIGGNGEEGLLTEAVREKPYSLVLLDEFEKADPKLVTVFLQVLDEGRLTSGSGKTVDFTNTIIIATSNAGSLLIANGLQQGQSLEQINKGVNEELLKVFKPELINRFDDVVVFKPLSIQDLHQVVLLKLKSLQLQLKEQGYVVDFDQSLIDELAKRGYDPVMGARPLRRLIQDTLEAKLSVLILKNQLPKGTPFRLDTKVMD